MFGGCGWDHPLTTPRDRKPQGPPQPALGSPASVHSGQTSSQYTLFKVTTGYKRGIKRYRKDSALTFPRATNQIILVS